MVNELQVKMARVVKVDSTPPKTHATAKGGLALTEAVANKFRLWSDCRKTIPSRKDPTQGFETTTCVAALVHGLLAGGRGFSATEPMRGDTPLLDMIGLRRAPSAETVEEVIKHLARAGGHAALGQVTERFVQRVIARQSTGDLFTEGFVPVFADGTLLETKGKTKEAIKVIDGKAGQLAAGAFVGSHLVASDFAPEGSGEQTLVRGFLAGPVLRVLRANGLRKKALVLLDSLHGDGPTLDQLERKRHRLHHIIGANKLVETERVLSECTEAEWIDTGAISSRRWDASGVCTCWIQCEGWSRKRLLVGRRFMREGEMIWRFSGVITDLDRNDPRLAKMMTRERIGFAEAVWRLCDRKQAMENLWKDLLSDLGLHHPPSGSVAANAVFLAVAGLAFNLATASRLLLLVGRSRRMRLWRFRRDVIDLAATVSRHARRVTVRLLDARERLRRQLTAAMLAVSRL